MEIYLPNFDVNEDEVTITDIYQEDGSYVKDGELLFGVENAKGVKDIVAKEDGYIKILCKKYEVKKTGDLLAVLFSNKEEYEVYEKPISTPLPQEENGSWNATKKAEILAQELHIDLAQIAEKKGGRLIKTEDVQQYADAHKEKKKSNVIGQRINPYDRERVIIIGAGKGAEIVIDILMDDKDKYVVGLVDSFEKQFESYSYPLISCLVDDFPEKIDRHQYDTVIFSIGSTLNTMQFRTELYQKYKLQGISFTNAIASDANIRRAVCIGENNVIMHNCYIGTGAQIGNNNMISYGMNLGHHSILGDNNLIAPGLITAGCVQIGNNCIFMTGVNTGSFVKIGDGVVLPVGYAVKEDIAEHTIIR